jgi:hypothetical protein
MAGQIRRDLGEGFVSYEAEWIAGLREALGMEGTELLMQELNLSQLRAFIRGGFEAAALGVLAVNGSAADAAIARRYLSESRDEGTLLQAARILRRWGSTNDIERLLKVAGDSYGEVRVAAAEAALALSPSPEGAAKALLEMGDFRLVSLVLQSWEQRDLAEVQGIVEGLLRHEHQVIRLKAVSYLIQRLSPNQLRDVLGRYLEGFHYYNVVCSLDRALYAPSPLREVFLTRLERDGYQSPRE